MVEMSAETHAAGMATERELYSRLPSQGFESAGEGCPNMVRSRHSVYVCLIRASDCLFNFLSVSVLVALVFPSCLCVTTL